MPILLQVNFTPGAAQAQQSQEDRLDSARQVAELAGLHWKIWIQELDSNTCGGIYLFEDLASAKAWGEDQLRPHLAEIGASHVSLRYFEVTEAPSRITRAPLDRVRAPA